MRAVVDTETLEPTTSEAAGFQRLLLPGQRTRETLAEYKSTGGYADEAWRRRPAELIDLVERSGLLGRGGSAFPAGRKWRAVASRPDPRVVLVNGAESEPASHKDHALLSLRPHLVIEGALLAARAVDARDCIFYLHAGDEAAEHAIRETVAELERAEVERLRLRIVTAPPGYVAGEETSAIQRASGKAARPSFKPPRAFERGVRGRPTLVQNVETLANVPLISAHGVEWFRAMGTTDLPGTILVTLSGAVARPGVYEVPGGAEIGWILEQSGGLPPGETLQALLPGGYFSGWLDATSIHQRASLTPGSLRRFGAALGTAAVTVVPGSVCGLAQAAALLRFFARESARQCGPCTLGTAAMADILERVLRGQPERDDLTRLRRYSEEMLPGRGACGHLDGATTAARTALTVFHDEIEQHLRTGSCGRPEHIILPGLEGVPLNV
jgi:NADH:ubiquinone oxidoreductase subunit F (NADH-binding)